MRGKFRSISKATRTIVKGIKYRGKTFEDDTFKKEMAKFVSHTQSTTCFFTTSHPDEIEYTIIEY